MRVRSTVCFVVALAGIPAAGFAQGAGASSAGAQPATVATGFDGGFFIQSPDGKNRLTFGMIVQTDGRFSTDDPSPVVDSFTLRKARPMFTGLIANYFDFKLVPDFGNGKALVQDAYFGIRFSPAFRVHIGKEKTPIGYELLESDPYLLFPERALASSLLPNRDIGISVQGDLAASRVSYAAGVYNGVPDGSSSSADTDVNNGKDLAGRVIVHPFARTKGSTPLRGLGFHVGGSAGSSRGALPSFATSVQQTYFSYMAGATANGTHTRIAPAVFYYAGPLGTFAEYMRSIQAVANGATQADVANHAWDVSGSWLLTGESASYGMVRPTREFDPGKGAWGAVQVVARYSALSVDRAAFDLGFTAPSASREARQVSIGANWYLTEFIKLYGTYERITFRDGAFRAPEHVILFRGQLAFGDRR